METFLEDLESDHRRFRRYLVRLTGEIERLARGERPDYFLLNMLAQYFAAYPDELHHKKEDILYVALADKVRGSGLGLANIYADHESLSVRGKRFAEIVLLIINEQELPIGRIVDEAREYRELLGRHMSGEDQALFSPARRLFNKNDWDEVNDAVSDLFAEDINYEKARAVLELEQSIDEYLGRDNRSE